MNTYGGGNYNPYSTTSYGSNGPANGGGFYNQGGGGGGGGFDDTAGGGGFGSPGSASKVRAHLYCSFACLANSSVLVEVHYVQSLSSKF
jgi:hypothetical protein